MLDRTSSIYAAVPAPTEIRGELGRGDPTPTVSLSNAFVVQSNLDYPNPFGHLQNLGVQISKKFG